MKTAFEFLAALLLILAGIVAFVMINAVAGFGTAVVWAGCVTIGGLVGAARGQLSSGLLWSSLLGPLGVIITLCLPNHLAAAKEKTERQLREEELQVQKEILHELRAARITREGHGAPESVGRPDSGPAPKLEVMEEYVPENLRPRARR